MLRTLALYVSCIFTAAALFGVVAVPFLSPTATALPLLATCGVFGLFGALCVNALI